MKTKLTAFLFLLFVQTLFSQNILGTWYGSLEIQGQKLPLILNIDKDGSNYTSTFDSPLQGAKGIPVQTTTFVNNVLTLEATKMGISYKGNFNGAIIDGTFSQGGQNLPLTLTRKNIVAEIKRPQEPKPPFAYDTQEVSILNETGGNILAGTLATPKKFDKKKPVLVMITGSGPQNRDEELFGHKPFLVISNDLAKKGIATLRLDDRGVGGSDKGKDDFTTADFATDISSAVNYLAKNGYKNIGLMGHSEGGMIAPIVSDSNREVKFLVLLASPGVKIEELMIQQMNEMARISGADEQTLATNTLLNRKMYSYINNYTGTNLKEDLKEILIADLKKLPAEEMPVAEIEPTAEQQSKKISSAWFRYFLKFNPDFYMSKVKIPVLAVNGSLDLQVASKENLEGIKSSLTTAKNKNFEILEMEGLNHLFQTAKTGNPTEYGQIEETVAPKVLDTVSNWILALK